MRYAASKKSDLHKGKEWRVILRMRGWTATEIRWHIIDALGEHRLIGEMTIEELDRVNAYLDALEREEQPA